ncbi:MAG TPA: hypothetical protein VH988_05625 [Thermoanaerobaculia bacterium]|nr:hypothetical protein [Thermoanaerobaculia bacterium]
MKKKKKLAPKVPEIVSLNEELFSLEAVGPRFEELIDRRLELAVAAIGTNFICDTFTCTTFTGTCGAFGCTTFKINK